jgi:hypothetical protein
MYEGRFTLDDYPKFWVKTAIEISTGKKKILKWPYHEAYMRKIRDLSIKCFRSSEKESQVLELVRGHSLFMQGRTVPDIKRNPVRIIDFIPGRSLYVHISNMDMEHEAYFYELFPSLFIKLKKSLEAIKFLHTRNYFHGGIRSDHIMMEKDTGKYIWIDFDLNQDMLDFDIWCIGNLIYFITGMGEHTFWDVSHNKKNYTKASGQLSKDDASAFLAHRIINLKKLFPYIPQKLNDILMHFSISTNIFYDNIEQIINDIDEVIEEEAYR